MTGQQLMRSATLAGLAASEETSRRSFSTRLRGEGNSPFGRAALISAGRSIDGALGFTPARLAVIVSTAALNVMDCLIVGHNRIAYIGHTAKGREVFDAFELGA